MKEGVCVSGKEILSILCLFAFMTFTYENGEDFPDDTVDKNLPCNAGDTSPIHSLGMTPHTLGQLKPMGPRYWVWAEKLVLCSKRSHSNEKPEHHRKE